MKAQLVSLIWAQGRHGLRTSWSRLAPGAGRMRWVILLMVLAGVLPFSGFFYLLSFTAFRIANPVHHAALLGTVLAAGQGMALVFGFFYLLSAFFYGRDLALLMSLPLRPWAVAASKFIWVLVGEWLSLLPLLGPTLLAYGHATRAPAAYWPAVTWTFLWLPVLPLALDGLLLLVLVRVADLGRSRDVLRVVGALVALGIAIGLQVWLRGGLVYGADGIEKLAEQVLAGNIPVALSRVSAPVAWLAAGLVRAQAAAPLLHSLLGAGGVLVLLWASEHHLLPSAAGGTEARRRSLRLTRRQLAGFARVRPPGLALFWRDLLLVLRTPVFFLNTALSLVLLPFLLALPVIMTPGEVLRLRELFLGTEGPAWAPLAVIAAATLAAATAALGSTAISREGRRLWQSAMLPVRPAQHVRAKLWLSAAGGAVSAIAALGLLLSVGGVGAGGVLVAVAGGALGGWAAGAAGIWVDLLRPHLDWTDPQQAMKGNLNSLLGLLATLVLVVPAGVAAGVAGIVARAVGRSPAYAALATFLLAVALVGLAGYLWATHLARTVYGGGREL